MTPSDLPLHYRSLREAARRQLNTLAADELEAFVAANEERERIFEIIRGREAEMATLDEARLTEIQDTIRQILADDVKITELATRQAAQAQEELAMVTQGMSALNAYANDAFSQSYFIDRSS